MKVWIECRREYLRMPLRYYLWSGEAPEWDNYYRTWMKRTTIGRYVCIPWLEFLLGPDFEYPEPGELAELEVSHVQTWEMV